MHGPAGPITAAGTILAVVLGCCACTAPHGTPTDPATGRPASPAVPSAPAFPAVQGPVLSASASADEWTRSIRVADADAAYAAARRRLLAGGFVLTKDRAGTGGGDGQACTAALCVGFTATDIPGAGPTLAYDVFHPSGITG